MITVIAHYRTTPEHADQVRDVLAVHSRASEAEPGCRRFSAHQAAEDPTRFALYEQYDDEAAFAAHRASEHFHVNIEQTVVPLLTERNWRAYAPAL